MNMKLLTGAGCLLLLVAALTPAALGHDERANTFDLDYPGPGSGAGVSGRYAGATGPATADETDYGQTIITGALLCDLEVLGDATAPHPLDETEVDGNSGGNQANSWDDGGFGGACHTNGYAFGPYNTPGCEGTAHADNGLVTNTFISAACDWKTTYGSSPRSTVLEYCVVNSVLQGGVPGVTIDCVTAFAACYINSMECAGGVDWCGADHVADGINYGHGSDGVPFPHTTAHQGDVAFNAYDFFGHNDSPCDSEDSTAAVFVFDAVNTDAAGNLHVHPAGNGEIWTTY